MLSKKYRFPGAIPPEPNSIFRGGCLGKCLNSTYGRLFLVLAFCNGDLSWLEQWADMDKISSLIIVNKCRQKRPWPAKAIVIEVENYGGFHHSYAWWNAENSDKLKDNDIVFFVKDENLPHHSNFLKTYRSFENMIEITNTNGFACLRLPQGATTIFHHAKTLVQHTKRVCPKADASGGFGSFAKALGLNYSYRYVPVCFGGIFSAIGSRIKQAKIWSQLEYHLRKDGAGSINACFTEMLWASILRDKVSPEIKRIIEGRLETKELYMKK